MLSLFETVVILKYTLGRHDIWWWTISPRRYHPPSTSSQCVDTDNMIYKIYSLLKFTVPK